MADAFVFTPLSPGGATLAHLLCTTDSADCRFGDMAREREGGKEGGTEGGEGRGLSTLSTNQNLCDRGA